MSNEVETTAYWEQAWGEYHHRLAGLMWDCNPPPESYLRKVAYTWERRNIAAKREDEVRKAAGLEPLFNLK